jgi:ribosomal protein S18 acetylase RimI-like enzyme
VRPAIASDARALAALRYEFRSAVGTVTEPEETFRERCEQWMAARLGPCAIWRCWVVDVNGEIQGNVWLQLIEKLPNPVSEPEYHGYISNLYVRPALQGSGFGTALLEECLRACEAQGVDAVVLWPTPRSRSLYTRHGFGVRDDLMERRSTSAFQSG